MFHIQHLAPVYQAVWPIRDSGPEVWCCLTPLNVLRLLHPTSRSQSETWHISLHFFGVWWSDGVLAARAHVVKVLKFNENWHSVMMLIFNYIKYIVMRSCAVWLTGVGISELTLSVPPRGNTFWHQTDSASSLSFPVGHCVSLNTFSKSPGPGLLLPRDLGFLPAQHMLYS